MGHGNQLPARPVPTPPPTAVTPCPPLPDIEIVDETGKVVSGRQVRMVGEHVRLWVRSVPTGIVPTNIRWTVAANTVRTYSQSTSAGTAAPLIEAELQVEHVSFHWINGSFAGESKSVTVTATVAGAAKTKTATFTVFRPRWDRFTTTPSSINICRNNFPRHTGTYLAAYDPITGKVGMEWNAQVTAPPDGEGDVGFTQLINDDRVFTLNNGTPLYFSTNGTFVLDDGAGGTIQYNGSRNIADNGSRTFDWASTGSGDSPASLLTASLMKSSANTKFRVYLMYRPAGPDSIWVTLSVATWEFIGQTTRIGAPASTDNNWNDPTQQRLPHTNGVDSFDLPEWIGDFNSIRTHA